MTSLYQRMPLGQSFPSLPTFAKSAPAEAHVDWAPFLHLIALVEQQVRLIARAEAELLLAEKAVTAAEASHSEVKLTVNQTADILGVRPQTVYEWIKAGKLQAYRTGIGNRTLRLTRSNVEAALQAHTQHDGRRKYARRNSNSSTSSRAKGGAASC